jgi:hypothetical protein
MPQLGAELLAGRNRGARGLSGVRLQLLLVWGWERPGRETIFRTQGEPAGSLLPQDRRLPLLLGNVELDVVNRHIGIV